MKAIKCIFDYLCSGQKWTTFLDHLSVVHLRSGQQNYILTPGVNIRPQMTKSKSFKLQGFYSINPK